MRPAFLLMVLAVMVVFFIIPMGPVGMWGTPDTIAVVILLVASALAGCGTLRGHDALVAGFIAGSFFDFLLPSRGYFTNARIGRVSEWSYWSD